MEKSANRSIEKLGEYQLLPVLINLRFANNSGRYVT